MARRYRETDSAVVREELSRYRSTQHCPDCDGTRLRAEARSVKLGEGRKRAPSTTVSHITLREAHEYFSADAARGQGRDRRQGHHRNPQRA